MQARRWHDTKPRTLAEGKRRWRWLLIAAVAAVLLVRPCCSSWVTCSHRDRPTTYADIDDHFKYGSIGSDKENGLPLRVMRVLPKVYHAKLPNPDGPRDWTNFGFIRSPGTTCRSGSPAAAASST